MTTTAKYSKKTIGFMSIVFILAVLVFLMISIIQVQESFAEAKTVSGTFKLAYNLAKYQSINPDTKCAVSVTNSLFTLKSAESIWNNATFYRVSNETNFTMAGGDRKVYGVITHPDGDQAFIESDSSWKFGTLKGGYNWSFESDGKFIGGTGKFKGTKALWKFSGKGKGSEVMIGEWEVNYY
jgi:hypothetical protein